MNLSDDPKENEIFNLLWKDGVIRIVEDNGIISVDRGKDGEHFVQKVETRIFVLAQNCGSLDQEKSQINGNNYWHNEEPWINHQTIDIEYVKLIPKKDVELTEEEKADKTNRLNEVDEKIEQNNKLTRAYEQLIHRCKAQATQLPVNLAELVKAKEIGEKETEKVDKIAGITKIANVEAYQIASDYRKKKKDISYGTIAEQIMIKHFTGLITRETGRVMQNRQKELTKEWKAKRDSVRIELMRKFPKKKPQT